MTLLCQSPYHHRVITVLSLHITCLRLYKLLKQLHFEDEHAGESMEISTHAMSILNSFMWDVEERLACDAESLATYSKNKTITSREMQTATRLCVPGQLAVQAAEAGTKLMESLELKSLEGQIYQQLQDSEESLSTSEQIQSLVHHLPETIVFPCVRIARIMREGRTPVELGAILHLIAVLQSLATNLLEPAVRAAFDDGKQRVTPRHIQLAVQGHDDLKTLFGRRCGDLPHPQVKPAFNST